MASARASTSRAPSARGACAVPRLILDRPSIFHGPRRARLATSARRVQRVARFSAQNADGGVVVASARSTELAVTNPGRPSTFTGAESFGRERLARELAEKNGT